jgi:hypothetical protein
MNAQDFKIIEQYQHERRQQAENERLAHDAQNEQPQIRRGRAWRRR